MRPMGIAAALWLGFVIIVVHNIEEHLAMGPFLAAQRTYTSPSPRGVTVTLLPSAATSRVPSGLSIPPELVSRQCRSP